MISRILIAVADSVLKASFREDLLALIVVYNVDLVPDHKSCMLLCSGIIIADISSQIGLVLWLLTTSNYDVIVISFLQICNAGWQIMRRIPSIVVSNKFSWAIQFLIGFNSIDLVTHIALQ